MVFSSYKDLSKPPDLDIHRTLSQTNPVDFLIVGAAKSGTTTLFETLTGHPGIFIPQRKECCYFSCQPQNFSGPRGPSIPPEYRIHSLREYRVLFHKAEAGQLRGDISTDYLYYYRNAVPKILDEVNAKIPIIIVLRNPIDRAYSNYLHYLREGWENLSFERALAAEKHRCRASWTWGWNYANVGLYAAQVKAYMDNFERVLLLLFERDIVMGQATGKILEFLNLDPLQETTVNVHANMSGYPKYRFLHWLMTDEWIIRKLKNVVKKTSLYTASTRRIYQKMLEANLKKKIMATKTRVMLKERFQDDVALLAKYTGLPVYKFWADFQ